MYSIIEHYADVFPNVAKLGPLLIIVALSILGAHYKFAFAALDKSTAYMGLFSYLAILVVSRVLDLG
jgi:hypothetical protein